MQEPALKSGAYPGLVTASTYGPGTSDVDVLIRRWSRSPHEAPGCITAFEPLPEGNWVIWHDPDGPNRRWVRWSRDAWRWLGWHAPQPDGQMTTITLRIPVDVVESLKEIAPRTGFSGYQALLKSYVSEGLRCDEAQFAFGPAARLVAALKRRGVPEALLEEAARELGP